MPNAISHETSTSKDLVRRVCRAITELGYPEHSSVKCESDGSTVTLNGKLSSFYLLQIAQAIAMEVPGVRTVVNKIEVCGKSRKSRWY
ncbi:BON domain-containing protein [Thalassoglobus polymorphus]|uniref:BON domain protein n=1 Tax=Thalassoglobus polymorphus TaxID=2527994 RepID=A0A517QL66_9PLAN|nr:BON domain-containing protein [Thalassoglobus polymorphus]QDT32364.1 BON domain protein [Thalassoglobus polymorphus]